MNLKLYFTILFTFLFFSANICASDTTEDDVILFVPPMIQAEDTDIYGKTFSNSPDEIVSFYSVENGSVYYVDSVNGHYLTKEPLGIVDLNSFKDLGAKYAKDKENVYYGGFCIQEKIDVASFNIITFEGKNQRGYPQFAKDKYRVFFEGNSLQNSDSNTFKKIENGFYADKNNMYGKDGIIIEGVNPQNYRFVGLNHIVSNGHVYFSNYLFDEVMDPASFEEAEGGCYYKDKYQLYTSSEVLSGADVNSYEISADCNYLKSNGNIYHSGNLIEGADADSFEIINSGISLTKDKNYVYDWGVRKEGIDPKNVRAINESYYCESDNLFFYSDLVCQVDGESFSSFNDSYFLFKDNNKLYYIANGSLESTIEVDGETIRQLPYNWFADKNRVFYLEISEDGDSGIFRQVYKVDPATFEVIDDNTVRDKDGIMILDFFPGK